MLKGIVYFSLRFKGIVLTLALLLLVLGLYVARNSKLDVFPDFVPPQATIQTEAPGLSPEQVETLITRPVETAINGVGNMEALRSESIQGLSVITVILKEGSDVLAARQLLAEKLSEVSSRLPVGVKPPGLSPLTSSTMDLLKVGLISEKLSPMELRTLADWTLKPRLLSVPGVARCTVYGGEVRQMQVQLKPERLKAFGISVADVVSAARLASGVFGAGFVETSNQRILIQTEGQALTSHALEQVVLRNTTARPVLISDVAEVREGAEPAMGGTVIQGKPGVLLSLSSQYGANTLEVTYAVEAALEELRPLLRKENVTVHPRLHRPATFIETSLKNIRSSLYLGALLVALVLFLFLGQFRTALISLTAIPLSLLSAIVLLDKFGVSLNTLTLGGLAIAIGEVVDDAIIDVENILRRLRENQALTEPRPLFQVVLDASLEVRSAVVYATFIVVLVFVPVLTLTGLQGKFFAPLAFSYILAIVASLVVALTITPALCLLCFRRGVRSVHEPRLQQWMKRQYAKLLRLTLPHPGILTVLLLLGCALLLPRLLTSGGEFLPEFREGHYVLQVNLAPGTSLKESLRVGTRLSTELLKIKGIDTVEQQVGRAERGEDTWGPNRSEFHVELKELNAQKQEETSAAIKKVLEAFPGITFEVLTFLGDRISESISGETAPIVVNVFGEDLGILDEKAAEVASILHGLPGASEVLVKSPPGAPQLSIRLRPERLAIHGFRPAEVLDLLQTAYQGTLAGQIYYANRVEDLIVILHEQSRQSPETAGDLLLRSTKGTTVPLKELADVELASGRYSIIHEGARRRQTVTCHAEGGDVGSLTARVKESLRSLNLPSGYYLTVTGTAEAHARARNEIMLHASLAGVGVLMLLSMAVRSFRRVLLILMNLPFALIGGIGLLWLSQWHAGQTEQGLTIGALVGFVTLFGITTRNSIMLISHFEHLIDKEGQPWNIQTVLRGSSERLVPILMTALVTALGLLPLAVGSGEAGREIEGPMAIVILGGLISSTVLNLLILPALALRHARFEPPAQLFH